MTVFLGPAADLPELWPELLLELLPWGLVLLGDFALGLEASLGLALA